MVLPRLLLKRAERYLTEEQPHRHRSCPSRSVRLPLWVVPLALSEVVAAAPSLGLQSRAGVGGSRGQVTYT